MTQSFSLTPLYAKEEVSLLDEPQVPQSYHDCLYTFASLDHQSQFKLLPMSEVQSIELPTTQK